MAILQIGRVLTLAGINQILANLAIQQRSNIDDWARVTAVLQAQSTDVLNLYGGAGTAEGTALTSILTDQAQLKNIFNGAATLGSVKDFRGSAARLTGTD